MPTPTLTAPEGALTPLGDLKPQGASAPKEVSPSRAATPGKPAPDAPPETTTKWQVVFIQADRIDPSPYQPRVVFDQEELDELTRSVRAKGVQQPVLVRTKRGDGQSDSDRKNRIDRFELIAGERRLRSSKAAGRKTIPAIVRDDLSDAEAAELCLLENVQRANLSAVEEARGYRRLMLDFKLSEARLSKKVGKTVAAIREMTRLLQLPEEVQDLLARRQLTAAHGYELLKLAASPKTCHVVALHAASNGVSAAALSREPLPNARDLKKRGLVAELGFGTKFEWKSECQACPHKALVQSGYASYCLRPEEWQRKQLEAAARQQDDQARVLEEAKRSFAAPGEAADPVGDGELANQEASSLPCLSQLKGGSYRNLSWGERPAGCDGSCPCRGAARDPHDAEKVVALCLDPQRYQTLAREERERADQERQRIATARCERALRLLQEKWDGGETAQTWALLLLPFLDGRIVGGHMAGDRWERIVRSVGRFLQVELPWDDIFADGNDDVALIGLLAANKTPVLPPHARNEEGADGDAVAPRDLQGAAQLAAGLLLAVEAQSAARWGGDTPLLDFVLGAQDEAQMALEIPGETAFGRPEDENHPIEGRIASHPMEGSSLYDEEDDEPDYSGWNGEFDGDLDGETDVDGDITDGNIAADDLEADFPARDVALPDPSAALPV